MIIKLSTHVCLGWAALLMVAGCGKGKTHYQAIVQVSVSTDCVEARQLKFGKDALTDADLRKYVDELKLPEKWSSPGTSVTKEEAFQRLKEAIQLNPDVGGFTLRVFGSDQAECESLAKYISSAIKTKAEQTAGQELAKLIESRQKEIDSTQEKLSAARKQLVGVQDGAYVSSQYRLTPKYEEEMQAKINNAQAEDTARANELQSLRKLQGQELRSALVKTEMGRIASTNSAYAVSSLLAANQAQKSAEKELDMAKSGAINETNAVGHAELKLEQANRNLTNTMAAYIKSLEIESEVARARREEMEKQLDKLRKASEKAGEKAGVEKEIETLNGRLNTLTGELEQWKLCQRMLPQAIRIGSIQVETMEFPLGGNLDTNGFALVVHVHSRVR